MKGGFFMQFCQGFLLGRGCEQPSSPDTCWAARRCGSQNGSLGCRNPPRVTVREVLQILPKH